MFTQVYLLYKIMNTSTFLTFIVHTDICYVYLQIALIQALRRKLVSLAYIFL